MAELRRRVTEMISWLWEWILDRRGRLSRSVPGIAGASFQSHPWGASPARQEEVREGLSVAAPAEAVLAAMGAPALVPVVRAVAAGPPENLALSASAEMVDQDLRVRWYQLP